MQACSRRGGSRFEPARRASLIAAMALKISVHVARTMDNMRDVKMAARPILIGVAQKDDIVAECGAANIAPKLGSRAAHHAGPLGDALAEIGELIDEVVGDRAALALAQAAISAIGAARGGPVNEARHLRVGRLLEAIEVIACVTAHVICCEAAALGLGRRELSAQVDQLRLIEGMANGILGRGKAAGRKLGLHPLGSVCCKFDFHMASCQRSL
jgi:hypothetical protein